MKNPTTVENLPSPASPSLVDTETLEILEAWARGYATENPAKLKAAQKELDEFKKAMNENLAHSGERIVYP